jgi:hypothetical protein
MNTQCVNTVSEIVRIVAHKDDRMLDALKQLDGRSIHLPSRRTGQTGIGLRCGLKGLTGNGHFARSPQ